MGVDLWGEVDREVGQSPVRKRDSLRRQYAKCFFMSEVQGEGNCGRVIDRGKEACEMCCKVDKSAGQQRLQPSDSHRPPHFPPKLRGYEQKRHRGSGHSEVSRPMTFAKPFPTGSEVDGELVQ